MALFFCKALVDLLKGYSFLWYNQFPLIPHFLFILILLHGCPYARFLYWKSLLSCRATTFTALTKYIEHVLVLPAWQGMQVMMVAINSQD